MTCSLEACSSLLDAQYDCIVIVGDNPLIIGPDFSSFAETIQQFCAKSISPLSPGSATFLPCAESLAPAGRLVFANSGPLNRDQDDVRRLYDAAQLGVQCAAAAGARRPLVCRAALGSLPHEEAWAAGRIDRCLALGALQAAYWPLELRELTGARLAPVDRLGYYLGGCAGHQGDEDWLEATRALEAGRRLARDIGGSDPERMRPDRIVDLLGGEFGDGRPEDAEALRGRVSMRVEASVDAARYPLMAAVDRGSAQRHRGRVVHLSYVGEEAEAASETLYLVGKGVTFDTGGLSLKTGGSMVGMHRDKCGAAALAGLFRVLADLRPPRLAVHCSLGLVRNSLGSGSYAPDEIITSRSGARVRVVNTDAEGRMVLADLLCAMRERATRSPEPHKARLFSVATLTGHAVLAYGQGYSVAMDNGPARRLGVAAGLQAAGALIADPFEISTVRREDWDFVRSGGPYEDLFQCNPLPSAVTPRGHQFPAAFLAAASGLDKHGLDSNLPLAYTHVDIAPSAGRMRSTPPTASPLLAFAMRYILPRLPRCL